MTLTDLQKTLSQEASGVETLVHCQLAQVRSAQTRAGKPYYRLRVADAQDGIDLNVWNDTAAYAAVENKLVNEGDFIELRGAFSKNDRGLNVQDIALRQLTDEEKTTLLNGSPERSADLEKWEAELVEAMEAMEDPLFRTLSSKIFSKMRVRFRRAAAAFKGTSRQARRAARTYGFNGSFGQGTGRMFPGCQPRFDRLWYHSSR